MQVQVIPYGARIAREQSNEGASQRLPSDGLSLLPDIYAHLAEHKGRLDSEVEA